MKWISVNDKLPEHQTDNYSYDVIVYDSYSRGVARAFYNFDLSEWKYHYNVSDDTFITTHWMPLPETPKESNMKWISVKDRLPTKDDANEYGEVVIWCNDGSETLYTMTKYDKIKVYYDITHWAKINPPKQ